MGRGSTQELKPNSGRKGTSFFYLTDGVCCPLSKNTTLVPCSGVTEEIGAFELWAQNKKLPKKRFLSTFFQENAIVALSQLFTGPFVEEERVERSTFCTREKCHLIKFERRTPS